MIIERVSRREWEKAKKDFVKLEHMWTADPKYTSESVLKESLKQQREAVMTTSPGENAEELIWENFIDKINRGRVAADMFCLYRKRTNDYKCPVCGASVPDGTEALSRRDNKTEICSDCGLREAFDDLAGRL